jgi:hypothetical protein
LLDGVATRGRYSIEFIADKLYVFPIADAL